MRFELVAGGILLLSLAVALKVIWDLRPLPRLALTLNLLWAVFAAFHGWPLAHGWAANVADMAWEGFPVDAGAFWVAFVVAVVPGFVLYRYTLRDGDVEFPRFFNAITGLICTAVTLWLVPCLVVMTLSIGPGPERHVLPEEGAAGEWTAIMRGSPLRLYLAVAESVGGEDRSDLLSTRIPKSLRQQVFPRRGRTRADVAE
jgi:hypothetical protein